MFIQHNSGRKRNGFSFDYYARNKYLEANGAISPPSPLKTGTTIAGIVFQDGVVLGADTRSTANLVVENEFSEKIHYLADNIYCCGAGTAADTRRITGAISAQLQLHRMDLATDELSRVVTATRMAKQLLFRYQGNIESYLILGGVDINGPKIVSIYPHGSTDVLPYVSSGSGGSAAMGVLESCYRLNLEEKEAVDLVENAIYAGIFNDLGSGKGIDMIVIKKDPVQGSISVEKIYRNAETRPCRPMTFKYPSGTTSVLSTKVHQFKLDVVDSKIL